MPLQKANPKGRSAALQALYNNGRRGSQTPPPRTGTADSGYFDDDRDSDADRPQSVGTEQMWDSNQPRRKRSHWYKRNRDDADAIEFDRAAEESRRQHAEDARVQQEHQAELQRASDESILAEQDAADRRREDEEEQEAIAESILLAQQEEAYRRQENHDTAIALADSAVEAHEAERRRAVAVAEYAERVRHQREAAETRLRNAGAHREAERWRAEEEAERLKEEETAREIERSRLQSEADESKKAADRRAMKAFQAAQTAAQQLQRQRLYDKAEQARIIADSRAFEATEALRQQQAEDELREDRAAQASEAALQPEKKDKQKRQSAQLSIAEAAVDLGRKEQEEFDLAVPFDLREPEENSSIQRTGLSSISQDDDDTYELYADPPAPTAVSVSHSKDCGSLQSSIRPVLSADQALVQKHLSRADKDAWCDRALTATPLLAPVARPQPLPAWVDHPAQSPAASITSNASLASRFPSSGSAAQDSDVSSLAAPPQSFVDSYYEPSKVQQQPTLTSASPRQVENPQGIGRAPLSALDTASNVATHNNSTNQPINFYGNVTVNNHFNVSIPVEKSRTLLRRALSQSFNKARGRPIGMAAVANAAREQTGQFASLIRSGVENAMDSLNIGAGGYVTNADMSLPVIDEGYETSSRHETPSPGQTPSLSLIADLEAARERLRTPLEQPLHQARVDENGSPASFQSRPLRVLNPSTPTPTLAPKYDPYSNNRLDDCVAKPMSPSRRPSAPIPPPSKLVTRKPLPARSNTILGPAAVPTPTREPNDSPDSMRAQNDTPSYTQRMLGRMHNHPPVNTAWGNVPAPTQNLPYTNSQAMMGANRFDDSRHEMPTLPRREGDAATPVIDRTITPNTKAKKAEKDAQKKLRGLM